MEPWHVPIALATAIISAAVSMLTALGTIVIARYNLRRQYRLEFMAEAAAQELLRQHPYRMRSFELIKHHLAGFEDDDLRRVLVRAGALRWQTQDGKEVWGLLQLNRKWLSVPELPVTLNNKNELGDLPPPTV